MRSLILLALASTSMAWAADPDLESKVIESIKAVSATGKAEDPTSFDARALHEYLIGLEGYRQHALVVHQLRLVLTDTKDYTGKQRYLAGYGLIGLVSDAQSIELVIDVITDDTASGAWQKPLRSTLEHEVILTRAQKQRLEGAHAAPPETSPAP